MKVIRTVTARAVDIAMRAVIYARYSTDLQRDASIEDQVRLCKERAQRESWELVATYTDHALSGSSRLRPGYQKLLEDARAGRFDIVLSEALDRLSRDQEDTAALYKQLSFCGVRLLTLSEGEISELHVGLKGTMNALFIKDLAAKIRRGMRGRIEQLRAGGGRAYGYRVVRQLDDRGERVRGLRQIDSDEAGVIRRIFVEYIAGHSPKGIAKRLNADRIPGPSGGTWNASAIHGNWRRGTGILNNDLYVGRLVWNRQKFIKDPATGRRVGRVNPENEWIVKHVPELQIVEQELWHKAKERQDEARRSIKSLDSSLALNGAHRQRYLLSGLLKCGECGSNYVIISSDRYGCAGHRNRGICRNDLTIYRSEIEERVLSGLKTRLLAPELIEEFIKEFTREANRIRRENEARRMAERRELDGVTSKIKKIVDAIEEGVWTASTKDRLLELEARKAEIENASSKPQPTPVRLHPNLGEIYRDKVTRLQETLNRDDIRTEAAQALRDLIKEIRLSPDAPRSGLSVELVGDLAAILDLTDAPEKRRPAAMAAGRLSLVAEEGLEPPTKGL